MQFRRLSFVLGVCLICLLVQGSAAPVAGSAGKSHRPGNPSKSAKQVEKPVAGKSKRSRRSKEIGRLQAAYRFSTELRPIAQELLENRSHSAYVAVERFARAHSDSDAGALAYLDLGYSRYLDDDFDKAITELKKARTRSWELSEYADYFLGMAYTAKGDDEDVIPVLDGFSSKYPNSVFRRDAALLLANSLIATGSPAHAAEVIQEVNPERRSDLVLTLGKAYLAAGQNDKAAAIFRRLYFDMPLSAQASEAGTHLQGLTPEGLKVDRDLRRTRAEILVRGRRYSQAAQELQGIVSDSGNDSIPAIKVELADALYRSEQDSQARAVLLSIQDAVGEVQARKLYLLAEIARSANDDQAHAGFLQRLRTGFVTSGWFQDALLSAGNMYLLRNDYKQAAAYYRELSDRFTAGRYGAVAHWKAAWLTYRMGDKTGAAQQFDEQISKFPDSSEVANALYWRGRVAEDDGELPVARAYYTKLSQRYRNFYYADLARERLKEIKHGPVAKLPLLNRIPDLPTVPLLKDGSSDVQNVRLQRARLLANGALFDYAVQDLKAAHEEGSGSWTLSEIARLEKEAGRPHVALQTLKRAVPGYFSMDINDLPRPVWEVLFPRPYWQDLRTYARRNGLDPYLVASLIRQESEFNPEAVSRANAYGLMQLLPSVGKKVAREVRFHRYSTQKLLDPSANIRLGTRYFKDMVDLQGDQVEYALAAYNAGSNRVADWKSNGPYKDVYEFVESIPFTENREYVQAIIRNASVYRRLYGQP